MAAPKGNQFWKARTKHGRDKLFASADLLWEACCEYFQWVEKHPLWESKAFHNQGEVVTATIPKMRAMTLDGLCLFLDVDRKTWGNWRDDEDFFPVITRVEAVIRDQKFSGAAADLLNANIIARDLGLSDKQQTEHSGEIKTTAPTINITRE
ncbi:MULTISPECIES: DNA-packaging protein [unclassified Halomonas]|uniref:DNA-packaging protein n=1 Tax=unclassified Halomonas TaxID=2609666 RepID=UPI000698DC91|nr:MULTISPECIES: DNA-packaging protein [unclassified Halomonas]